MASVKVHSERKSDLKRRHDFEETHDRDLDESRQFKRPHLTHLPIRPSSVVCQETQWHSSGNGYQPPLTPVDSSDDEGYGQPTTSWKPYRAATPAQRASTPVNSKATNQMTMGMGLTFVSAAKQAMFPQSLHPSMAQGSAFSLDERIPTPISTVFDLSEKATKPHSRQRSVHTMLSPVMGDSPCPPSPAESNDMDMDTDMETTMQMDHASSDFGQLSVACNDDEMMDDVVYIQEPSKPLSTTPSQQKSGRNAKLHMGYRADCEKCQQRVPGHYSHIIWS